MDRIAAPFHPCYSKGMDADLYEADEHLWIKAALSALAKPGTPLSLWERPG
jgi:hypothetical protein